MIKKSLIVFVILFVLLNIVAKYNKLDPKYAQSDIQLNTMNGDNFIFNNDRYNAVILGSSLASRLSIRHLPGFYNLSFSGLSVYDGGAVLLSRETIPPVVFIEINAIQKPKNENFTLEFESPVYSYFKRAFPALRTENQPVILFKKFMDNLKPAAPIPSKSKSASKTLVPKNIYLPEKMFQSLLYIQVKSYSTSDQDLMDKSIVNLKELVAKIQSRGSRVIFFEMPVNPVIQQSPKATLIRLSVAQNFPFYQVDYIPLPPMAFKTRDGIHLAQKEAIDYTLYFKKKAHDAMMYMGKGF